MEHDSDAGGTNAGTRLRSTASPTNDPDGEKDTDGGAYVVIDTETHEQHARGLSKARAEALAREYCDGIEARRAKPDPHWLQRVGGADR